MVLVAYAVLSAIMVGLGALVVAVDGVTRWDVSINRWFVRQRLGWLDASTAVGSRLAETLTVIVLGSRGHCC